MKYIFALFCLAILNTSCKNKELKSEIFPSTIKINHSNIFNEEKPIFIGGEMLFFKSDSSLIVHNFKNDSLLIKLNLKDKKIAYYLPVGNGANEFIHINIAQRNSDSTFLFQDMNSAQLYQMNILSGEIKRDFSYKDNRCMEVVKIDSNYISTGIYQEGMFAIWNNNNIPYYTCEYPQDKVDNSKMACKAMAYQGKILANKELKRILFCSSQFSYFELFQFDNQKMNTIKKSYLGEYEYITSPDDNSIFGHPLRSNREGYIDADATDKRIYLLYSGRSIEDPNITTLEKASLSNQILVYDWEGIPLLKYETDVDLQKICVNSAENIIYGIAYNPDPEIVYFKL